MNFHVAQLLKEPVGAIRKYDIEEDIAQIGDATTTEPLSGHVTLIRTDRGILVEADLQTSVRLSCSRCLEELTYPLHMQFKEEFQPTLDINTGLPAPPPADKQTFTIDESHVLDLTEAVRQYGILSLPMQPLCRPDCAGLCPQCGQSLNYGRCHCQMITTDSRWARLESLLKEKENSDDQEPKDS
ncbi:MAG: DUF177 domain-containing protein [Chloroflexi bacterium]|nr:DUF177 domain-containing protein [Chloroflexota bacterium]MCL5074105.1 DUF177 domain-containing protein [Chloroflexota bacterium]